jgi:hypothetical protein
MSTGPSSFGPTEEWDFLYFVDCTKYKNKIFKIYEIKISNKNKLWYDIKINKNETYKDQCLQGRRPRICFSSLYEQLNKYITILFNGKLNDLY